MKFKFKINLAFVLSLIFLSIELLARVGGGESYGGSNKRSGGGFSGTHNNFGSGDASFIIDLIYLVIRFCFRYPQFGIPILIILVYFVYKIKKNASSNDSYYQQDGSDRINFPTGESHSEQFFVNLIQSNDSNFSYPPFIDFINALFHSYYKNKNAKKNINSLTAFIDEKLLISEGINSIQGIVIGQSGIVDFNHDESNHLIKVKVKFEANYTIENSHLESTRYKTNQIWTCVKKMGVLSKAPDQITILVCYNCNAPIENVINSVCSHCGQSHKNGQFSWFISDIEINDQILDEDNQSMIENKFSGDLIDYGVDLPTVKQPLIDQSIISIFRNESDKVYFRSRAQDIFLRLQSAWSEKKWEIIRPFESDTLFESHKFWIDEFIKNRQTNHVIDPVVEKIIVSAIYTDKFYVSITVRIFASMIDFTSDETGKIVKGHPKRRVSFSEYWTFIKANSDTIKDSKVKDINLCPSCGASLHVGLSGKCSYCDVRITLGQFDWVLSRIQQDETYTL